MSSFLSGIAVVLSTLAFLLSGFTAYQVFGLRQAIESVRSSANNQLATPTPSVSSPEANSSNSSPAIAPVPSPAASAPSAGVQPGQFVQPAFGNKGRVELLSVKRIKDPEVGNRDVVNVQMRVRRLADDVVGSNMVVVGETSARNPDTSETYKAVDFLKRSSGTVSLFTMRRGASADAYVWPRVPEGVNTIDIFIPETAAFKNVPIAN